MFKGIDVSSMEMLAIEALAMYCIIVNLPYPTSPSKGWSCGGYSNKE